MNHRLDRPPMDNSGRGADGAGAPSQRPAGTISCDPPPAPRPTAEARGTGETRPMIKPSPHEKVAIAVHRQDWP